VEVIEKSGRKHAVYKEFGDPRQVIVDQCKFHGADFLVIGSHGRSGLKKLFLGSVSDYCLRHAPWYGVFFFFLMPLHCE
jgi:nucleotide-binding universal stress UspA family protein